jgi:hypothetical protein
LLFSGWGGGGRRKKREWRKKYRQQKTPNISREKYPRSDLGTMLHFVLLSIFSNPFSIFHSRLSDLSFIHLFFLAHYF